MRNVIPIITGNTGIPNEGNLPFTSLESLTGDLTVNAVPDFFDGAPLRDVDKRVREDLSQVIVPTKHANAPVAPNFFLEAKAPQGGADVARHQACYDGVYGARAMQSLQSYGKKPVYDGNAYTYSSTYHDGTLRLYAHHPTAPTTSGGRLVYHMTRVKGFDMLSDRDTCAEGIRHFGNARDLARRHRIEFIQGANARTRRSDDLSVDEAEAAADAQRCGDSGSDEFVDCDEYTAPGDLTPESIAACRHVDEGPALSHSLYAKDEECNQESMSLGLVEPVIGFTTSSSTPGVTHFKRNRSSHSPPAELQLSKKQDLAKTPTRRGALGRSTTSDEGGSGSWEGGIKE